MSRHALTFFCPVEQVAETNSKISFFQPKLFFLITTKKIRSILTKPFLAFFRLVWLGGEK
jgi:hypothetical protein